MTKHMESIGLTGRKGCKLPLKSKEKEEGMCLWCGKCQYSKGEEEFLSRLEKNFAGLWLYMMDVGHPF